MSQTPHLFARVLNCTGSPVCASLSLVLRITNGDSVTGTFGQVRFPGTYLAWKDVLHDGPVPQTSTLNELSDIRAHALAAFGWGDAEKLRADFANRDRTLQDFRQRLQPG